MRSRYSYSLRTTLIFAVVLFLMSLTAAYTLYHRQPDMQERRDIASSSTTDIETIIIPPPADLTYITIESWPTNVEVQEPPFACDDQEQTAIQVTTGTQVLEQRFGKAVCITTRKEGAAGSVYETKTYEFDAQASVHAFTLIARFSQCANYDEPEQTACTQEQAAFSLDDYANQILSTLR